ncbi:DEAD/DEAH box helicase family protein [Mycobacterium persicum]|uniref:DEAD/DEAH box helicase family protein n=1 Tax=Mycobacterium persicum TaxID=1487726 RepID=UPI0013C2F9EE|nr:DEAD/DEAH box helicase family protein [Mycobacterium persicum]
MSDLSVDSDLLDEITHRLELRAPNAAAVEAVVKAVSQHFDVEGKDAPFECIVDSATGVGKTYVLAGLIEYLAGRDTPARNFLLLAPGRTIRDKSINNFTPGHKKSLTPAMKSRPEVITADNFQNQSTHAVMEDTSKTKLFIFTVQALTSSRGDEGRATHEFQETLGASFYQWLSNRDDLVILADEHHTYRGRAFSKTIADLKPSVVIGLTATPDKRDNDLVVYRYPLSHAIRDKFVKTPVLVARRDDRKDDHTKLMDGVTLLKYKEQIARAYCEENDLPVVNPVMLVIAKDTTEANAYRDLLDSETFDGGAWVGKTLLVHSNLTGDDKEDALAALDAVEEPDSPVRIIISVGMLKEGWDVKNVYVIASMRASVSDVLTEQTLGRGMRLPFGEYTGIQMLDTVEILAHERYEELLAKREALNEQFVDYGVWMQTRLTESGDTIAEKKITDPLPASEITSPTGADGAESSIGPMPVQDIEQVAAAAAAEADNAKTDIRQHEPLSERQPIVLPYVEHVPVEVVVSLNQIDDDKDFQELGKGLAIDAKEELQRTVLKAEGSKIKGVKAEDVVKASVLDIPLDQSRRALVDAVLSTPGVTPRTSEVNAAEKIVDAVIGVMGDDAPLWLSSYLETAKRRLSDTVATKLTSVTKGGITYSDEVKLEPLTKVRKSSRTHQKDLIETFQKGVAYDGWKRNLYEYAWFDSSPEYAAAKAIDEGEHVVVWARLHINDIPITWTSSGQKYNPDFVVVEEIDGKRNHWLVEIKMDKDVASEDVTAKKKAAATWAKTVTNSGKAEGDWAYLLLSESDVKDSHGNWEQMKAFHQ